MPEKTGNRSPTCSSVTFFAQLICIKVHCPSILQGFATCWFNWKKCSKVAGWPVSGRGWKLVWKIWKTCLTCSRPAQYGEAGRCPRVAGAQGLVSPPCL